MFELFVLHLYLKVLFFWSSVERLALSAQACGSNGSPIVDNTNRLMALVTWQLDTVVLDNVLLDDCVTCIRSLRLVNCLLVHVDLRDEAVVAWDVVCHLSRANREVIDFVHLLCGLGWKNVSRIMSILSERFAKFCHVPSSRRAVGLTIDGPEWAPRLDFLGGIDHVIHSSLGRDPVVGRIGILRNRLTGGRKTHRLEGGVLVAQATVHGWLDA